MVLEGLITSGKSYLTEQPFALSTGQSVNIELDGFLRKPVNPDTEYMGAIGGAANEGADAPSPREAPDSHGRPSIGPIAASRRSPLSAALLNHSRAFA